MSDFLDHDFRAIKSFKLRTLKRVCRYFCAGSTAGKMTTLCAPIEKNDISDSVQNF